jgi:HAD superfamily hydrolase (TIGR01549 family)
MGRDTDAMRTVLFDWDGTLMDSARYAFGTFQKTFGSMGIALHPQTYEAIYSPNWYSMYQALGLAPEKWSCADAAWLKYHSEEPVCEVAGARATVGELLRRGYRLGLVSSGTGVRVRQEIETLGFGGLFEAVVCCEDTLSKKPHPEGLEKALRMMAESPDFSCYVGDSPEDVMMGKSARVLTVGIRSGYPGSRRLDDAQPDLLLPDVRDLLNHLRRVADGNEPRRGPD